MLRETLSVSPIVSCLLVCVGSGTPSTCCNVIIPDPGVPTFQGAPIRFTTTTAEHDLVSIAVQAQPCSQGLHHSHWRQGRDTLFNHDEMHNSTASCEVPPMPLGTSNSSLIQVISDPFLSSNSEPSVPQEFTKNDGQSDPARTEDAWTFRNDLRESSDATFILAWSFLTALF